MAKVSVMVLVVAAAAVLSLQLMPASAAVSHRRAPHRKLDVVHKPITKENIRPPASTVVESKAPQEFLQQPTSSPVRNSQPIPLANVQVGPDSRQPVGISQSPRKVTQALPRDSATTVAPSILEGRREMNKSPSGSTRASSKPKLILNSIESEETDVSLEDGSIAASSQDSVEDVVDSPSTSLDNGESSEINEPFTSDESHIEVSHEVFTSHVISESATVRSDISEEDGDESRSEGGEHDETMLEITQTNDKNHPHLIQGPQTVVEEHDVDVNSDPEIQTEEIIPDQNGGVENRSNPMSPPPKPVDPIPSVETQHATYQDSSAKKTSNQRVELPRVHDQPERPLPPRREPSSSITHPKLKPNQIKAPTVTGNSNSGKGTAQQKGRPSSHSAGVEYLTHNQVITTTAASSNNKRSGSNDQRKPLSPIARHPKRKGGPALNEQTPTISKVPHIAVSRGDVQPVLDLPKEEVSKNTDENVTQGKNAAVDTTDAKKGTNAQSIEDATPATVAPHTDPVKSKTNSGGIGTDIKPQLNDQKDNKQVISTVRDGEVNTKDPTSQSVGREIKFNSRDSYIVVNEKGHKAHQQSGSKRKDTDEKVMARISQESQHKSVQQKPEAASSISKNKKPVSLSNSVAMVSILLISIVTAVTILGVYFKKISFSRKRYGQHIPLSTEEDDLTMFNRQTSYDSPYESWRNLS